jgi:hypothetical protein
MVTLRTASPLVCAGPTVEMDARNAMKRIDSMVKGVSFC